MWSRSVDPFITSHSLTLSYSTSYNVTMSCSNRYGRSDVRTVQVSILRNIIIMIINCN